MCSVTESKRDVSLFSCLLCGNRYQLCRLQFCKRVLIDLPFCSVRSGFRWSETRSQVAVPQNRHLAEPWCQRWVLHRQMVLCPDHSACVVCPLQTGSVFRVCDLHGDGISVL